jgi:hypothetical protein
MHASIRFAITLSDLAAPRLEVACAKCGRKGSYNVAKLYAERGEREIRRFAIRGFAQTYDRPILSGPPNSTAS